MSHQELIDAIIERCRTKNGCEPEEILALIAEAGAPTAILERQDNPTLKLDAGPNLLVQALGGRSLVMLDLETTSAQIDHARIIEVAAIKIYPDGRREAFETLVNPGFEIDPEIEELTGITNEELSEAMDFAHYADELLAFLHGSIISGFNVRNFDAPILWEEFHRAGRRWPVAQEHILDVMEIFHKAEPRSLTGAVRFYLGKDHEGAHRAAADAEATLEVLEAMLKKYQSLPQDVPDLIAETRRDNRIDMAGKIAYNAEGVACFNFGKHGPEGGKTPAPCTSQRHYLRWMLDQGTFPANTLDVVRQLLGE